MNTSYKKLFLLSLVSFIVAPTFLSAKKEKKEKFTLIARRIRVINKSKDWVKVHVTTEEGATDTFDASPGDKRRERVTSYKWHRKKFNAKHIKVQRRVTSLAAPTIAGQTTFLGEGYLTIGEFDVPADKIGKLKWIIIEVADQGPANIQYGIFG